MYKERLNDCFTILGLAHRLIDNEEVKVQLTEVASRYRTIVRSNKKLTKKRLEKLEVYIDVLSSFNKNEIIENGLQLLKKV